MTVLNEVKFIMDSRSQNEAFSRSAVAAFISQLDPLVEELADIKAAVSEAVTNCIVHAYAEKAGKIEVTVKIKPENTVYIRVKDKGCGIADVEQAMLPLYTTSAESERAGLGFSVMEAFTDKLTVKSKPNEGTTVVMVKKLATRYE